MLEEINRTNCKNCGAPLHYDLKNRKAKCNYCSTEYHLDNLGRVEEYKVEIEIMGERKRFYISKIEIEPVYADFGRDLDGRLINIKKESEMKLELISY